jgi:hypothetical protein
MGIISELPKPSETRSSVSRPKMHLRFFRIGSSTYRVVTLRPATPVAFSTNFFHQTWHLVTSQRGAHLLGRLLWGLSYQRHPGTLLVIHGDNLLPTPFEAERSDPFLLSVAGLTRLNAPDLRILKSRLNHLGPPAKTIRWHSFGLDLAWRARQEDHDDPSSLATESELLRRKGNESLWHQERMERLGGFICYSAPPPILRQQALIVYGLRVWRNRTRNMDYHFLARESSRDSWCADGEVQIFADYMERVAAAKEARQELLSNPRQPILSETIQEDISRRRDEIKANRRSRKRRMSGDRS